VGQAVEFSGYPKDCLDFLDDLAANNNKAWFQENKTRYEESVLEPSRAFVRVLARRFPQELSPGLTADPRINKSLFKIYRDIRFSKDKTPFKTHVGLWFWEGGSRRMEWPGFYFHLEPNRLFLAAGMHIFPKAVLPVYRNAVVHEKLGPALVKLEKDLKNNGLDLSGRYYKIVPRGFDKGHANARFLLYNGLTLACESVAGKKVHQKSLVDHCLATWQEMLPLHKWLLMMLEAA
jgi:uncharacterized protein (TIGR02453 family)